MKRNKGRYGYTFYTKNIFQSLLWLIEAVGIPMLFVFLLGKIAPLNPQADVFYYVERYLACYGVYQVLVIVVLKSFSDCKKDQTLMIITTYEYLKLFAETGNNETKDWIVRVCKAQQDSGKMNSLEIRHEYETILEMLANLDNIDLQYFTAKRLILFKHEYERIALLWNYSFLVRLFK